MALCICFLGANTASAQITQSSVEQAVKAVIADDIEAYKAGGTEGYHDYTEERFKRIVDAVQKNLKSGYKLEFLGTLKARDKELTYEIWKVSFSNEEPDLLLRIWVKDGKYSNLWWHWQ